MVINNIRDRDRLKIVLQVTLVGETTVYFKLMNIDDDAKKLKDKDIIYESTFTRFKIKRGDMVKYSPGMFTLPLSITNNNYKKMYHYNFQSNQHRKVLLRGLSKYILKFVQDGTFGHNPDSRVEYKKNYWFFY
jgi:hypothetical protein